MQNWLNHLAAKLSFGLDRKIDLLKFNT